MSCNEKVKAEIRAVAKQVERERERAVYTEDGGSKFL